MLDAQHSTLRPTMPLAPSTSAMASAGTSRRCREKRRDLDASASGPSGAVPYIVCVQVPGGSAEVNGRRTHTSVFLVRAGETCSVRHPNAGMCRLIRHVQPRGASTSPGIEPAEWDKPFV